METHVVDGKIPLLLSQHAQAALHLTKSMGDAKCYVGNEELELCRARNSGLLCVNLSEGLKSLKSKRLPKQLRELKNTEFGMNFNIRPTDQLTARNWENPTRVCEGWLAAFSWPDNLKESRGCCFVLVC